MNSQGNSYFSKNVNISNSRYDNSRLGDRTITSNMVDGKRYFSSLDAELYFGGTTSVFIDEILEISWSISQTAMPIFGYNSYTFDDLAVGSRIINGSFTINFTKSRYLYDVLKSIDGTNRASFYNNTPSDDKINWSTNFDKEHNASWDKSFNIVIGYGDYNKKGKDTTMALLHCVQIISCQQQLNVQGRPIAETYEFIAKDIRYESTNDSSSSSSGSNNEQTSNRNNFIFNINKILLNEKEYDVSVSHDNSIIKEYIMDFDYMHDNGTVRKILCTLKKANEQPLNTRSFELPINGANECKVPSDFNKDIEKEVKYQNSKGIKNPYIYADVVVEYENQYEPNGRYRIKMQKVSII